MTNTHNLTCSSTDEGEGQSALPQPWRGLTARPWTEVAPRFLQALFLVFFFSDNSKNEYEGEARMLSLSTVMSESEQNDPQGVRSLSSQSPVSPFVCYGTNTGARKQNKGMRVGLVADSVSQSARPFQERWARCCARPCWRPF